MFGRYWLVVHSHSTPRFHDPELLWPTISQKLFIENQTTATLKVLDTSNEAMIESSHFRNLIAAESFNIISCVRSALTYGAEDIVGEYLHNALTDNSS